MISTYFRNLQARLLRLHRGLIRTYAIWLRAGLCFAIGFSFFVLENSQSFDLRFQVRPSQPLSDEILLIDIPLHEWERFSSRGRSFMLPLREFTGFDDFFFWNEKLWQRILEKLLAANPQSIGVSFFFPASGLYGNTDLSTKSFRDPRVFWLARQDSDGRSIAPFAAKPDGSNAGLLGVAFDDDRVVRRYLPAEEGHNLAPLLLGEDFKKNPSSKTRFKIRNAEDNYLLNYRQPSREISRLTLAEVLSKEFDPALVKDKIILIGTSDIESHLLRTPLGDMNRAEVIATQVDNLKANRFIESLPAWSVVIFLLIQLALCIWVMSSYPQSIAFIFLVWIGTGWTAFSFWVFDSYYLWLPILAPIAQTVVTYVIFLGYQLTLKENEAWRLEQEKKYLSEIEQLKNNFVSLISHDLKTPIAKIQAICDRLLAQHPQPEVLEGLQSLRQESSELHRYIQSILKMSRVESRNFQLNKEAADINDLVGAVSRQLAPLAKQKNLQITYNLEPIFSLDLDALLVQEVILNLIENAIKYTPDNGKIEVSSREIENEIILSVSDSGPGIPFADQNKVFEKFYRSPEQELNTKGTGLGLYLVKYFVELHGGKVFLESQPGEGTQVGFRLPTDQESVQVRPSLTSPEENP